MSKTDAHRGAGEHSSFAPRQQTVKLVWGTGIELFDFVCFGGIMGGAHSNLSFFTRSPGANRARVFLFHESHKALSALGFWLITVF